MASPAPSARPVSSRGSIPPVAEAETEQFVTERLCIKAVQNMRPEGLIRRYLEEIKNIYFDSYEADEKNNTLAGTVLHAAAGTGMTWLVELLITSYGMDVNLRRKSDGCTPLLMACYGGRLDTVSLLMRLNANFLATASGGRGAIGYVMGGVGGDCKEWILDFFKRHLYGSCAREQDVQSAIRTAAHVHGNRALVTPVMFAASIGCNYAIELLAWAGEDPNYVGLAGKTALLLIASGISFNVLPNYRNPDPTWRAHVQVKAARSLVLSGANVNATVQKIGNRNFVVNEIGMTALHLLVNQGEYFEGSILPMFTTLLECGADPLIKDAKSRSVLTLVHEKNMPRVVQVLKEHFVKKGVEYPYDEEKKCEKAPRLELGDGDGPPMYGFGNDTIASEHTEIDDDKQDDEGGYASP